MSVRCVVLCALLVAVPSPASAEPCKRVRALTVPCSGRLIPDGLYLELWRTKTVDLRRVRQELAECTRDAAKGAERAAERLERLRRLLEGKLASCDTQVADLEAALVRKLEPVTAWYASPVLWGLVGVAVGVGVGLVVGLAL